MVRCVFSDFDQFADSISGVEGRYIPTARATSAWWIEPMRVGRLELQQLQIGAPATFAGAGQSDSITLGIPLTQAEAIRINGESLREESVVVVHDHRSLTYSSQLPARWASLTVPLDTADRYFRKRSLPRHTIVAADTAARRRLSLLIAMLCSESDASHSEDPEAIAAAEEEIVTTIGQLLQDSAAAMGPRAGRPRLRREHVIARCLEYLRERAGSPVLVADLCRVAEVSERTLRNVFCEYFGVGPIRFLKARQLQEVRAALMKADHAETVIQVAARHGVWDLSQFARNYRALYGENPADTLHTWRRRLHGARGNADDSGSRSWTNYAALHFPSAAEQSMFD